MRRLTAHNNKSGFTLVELMVVVALLAVVMTAGGILLSTGQKIWTVTDTKSRMQNNMRTIVSRIGIELQQSGRDETGTMQVSILEGAGANGADTVRFSIPLCVCGMSPIDDDGNVSAWGAPLTWGRSGCGDDYEVANNGKVDICHLPPGNPGNEQDLSVNVNAVKAHLAHGDRLGDCADCSPATYTNRSIQYSVNASGQLIRSVLDSSNTVLQSEVMADSITDFQAVLNAGQTAVQLTVDLQRDTSDNRTLTMSDSVNIKLRNLF